MPAPTPEAIHAARDAALQQFKQWAADPKTLCVNTETPSLGGPVWAFAAVRPGQLSPVLAFVCALPAGTQWSLRALEMHAERLPEIAVATQPSNLTPALVDLMMHNKAVAYGANFDAGAINRTWDTEFKVDCAQTAYAVLAGRWSEKHQDWSFVSLAEACKIEGIELSRFTTHTALSDAQLLGLLIQAVARQAS